MPSFRVTKQLLDKIKKTPSDIAETLTIDELVKLLTKLSDAYYNTDKPLLEDKTYDILFDNLKTRDPDNDFIKTAGSKVKANRRKVNLPYPMGSLDKIKPNEGYLDPWLTKNKGPYIVSDKLDGVSAQIYRTPTGKLEMYTRGEGTDEGNVGEDITHLLDYINAGKIENIPKDGSIRGELIMTRSNFDTISDQYKNGRNIVSGIVNAKVFDKNLAKLVDFVAYSILNPNYKQEEQMKTLKKWKINTAPYKVYKELTEKTLEDYLKDRRKNSDYDVDGIVIVDSSKVHELKPGNPNYAFAFKMVLDDQFTIATVKSVIWEVSMDSIFKPVVEINPVNLVGVTVSRATAHNAKFVDDNKLGKGAEIKIIRSGDVIPYINEVASAAKEILMPDKNGIKWEWNDSKVDALLVDASTDVNVAIKRITHFMRTLGVVGVSEGVITRLFEAGYRSLADMLAVPIDSIAGISGFSLKSGTTIYKAIHSVCDAPINLALLMDASNCFEGFGFKKMDLLVKNIPTIATKIPTEAEITRIAGFSSISAEKIIANLPGFYQWLKDHPMLKWQVPSSTAATPTGTAMVGQVVVMTGFRDDDISSWIEANGGKMGSSVSGKTTLLLVKDTASGSSKMEKAKELGVEIMSGADFKKKHKI